MDDNRQELLQKKLYYKHSPQQKSTEEDTNKVVSNFNSTSSTSNNQSPPSQSQSQAWNRVYSRSNSVASLKERDSLTLNEQKVAKLNKIFDDALNDFTSASEVDEPSSLSRNYRDRKLGINEARGTSPYHKIHSSIGSSNFKYELGSSSDEKIDTINRSFSEKISVMDYPDTSNAKLIQQRRIEWMKQQGDVSSYYARSTKNYTSPQKPSQIMSSSDGN